jgi:Meiotically up-regulated gene 113
VKKADILSEIVRTATANGGVPLGFVRFASETGIKKYDWFGKHWSTWGDAVREAGFTPNKLNSAYNNEFLLAKYAELARQLGRIPAVGDLLLKCRTDPDFPSKNTFERFGSKVEMIKTLLKFCQSHPGFESVAEQCEDYLRSLKPDKDDPPSPKVAIGYVYLMKHGSRREYKIGRTNNPLRREGEIGIELPEKLEPIHVIETDDPAGIEAYWHRRFAEKRLKNEWFALTVDDVRAFKRWRRIN